MTSACPYRTKRSPASPGTGALVLGFTTEVPRTNVAPSLGSLGSAVEILAISLQPGYFCARDVNARTYACVRAPGRCTAMVHMEFGNVQPRRAFILRDRMAQDRCALSRQKDCAGRIEKGVGEREREREGGELEIIYGSLVILIGLYHRNEIQCATDTTP